MIITNYILKYIRGQRVESLYQFLEGQAEIIELVAGEKENYLDTPIKQLKIPNDVIIATIVRKNEVIIPYGDDVIKEGDRVIVITKHKGISALNQLLGSPKGGLQNELRNGIKKLGNIINF